jgi:hypothetical protein
MSEQILKQIKSQFGVEVGVLETPKFYKVKGINRRFYGKDLVSLRAMM